MASCLKEQDIYSELMSFNECISTAVFIDHQIHLFIEAQRQNNNNYLNEPVLSKEFSPLQNHGTKFELMKL